MLILKTRFFEYPEFPIEEEYANNLQIVYSALFYAPVFPVVLLWSMISLFFKFWVDKVKNEHIIKY